MALATSTLREPVRSSFFPQLSVRLAAVQWGGDRRERELGREDLVLAGGEGAREAGV